MLLVFDMEHIGRFEMELSVRGTGNRFCTLLSKRLSAHSQEMEDTLRNSIQHAGYHWGDAVDRLERSRSLMDVFRSLPYKRTGVDVKI